MRRDEIGVPIEPRIALQAISKITAGVQFDKKLSQRALTEAINALSQIGDAGGVHAAAHGSSLRKICELQYNVMRKYACC